MRLKLLSFLLLFCVAPLWSADSTILPRGTRTADSFTRAVFDISASTYTTIQVRVRSSDYSSKPRLKLALWLERSLDGGTTWENMVSFTSNGGHKVPTMTARWDGQAARIRVTIATTAEAEFGIGLRLR